jgi:hypothetical protein
MIRRRHQSDAPTAQAIDERRDTKAQGIILKTAPHLSLRYHQIASRMEESA